MAIARVVVAVVAIPLFVLLAIALVAAGWAFVEHRDAGATFWGVFNEVGRVVGSVLPF